MQLNYEARRREAEQMGELLAILFFAGHIELKDIMPIIKKGTAKMFNEKEDKMFKQ